ncbi:hypothetical protein V2H45_15010 [Tumidithrix elongata RA019]|uniref:Uncharacterized protein n=1 Tax=Tumidithrix elongata BACA0141 TaxID=2716417 RepID=A0AAW9Q2G3_9CYAN|nr:hypothetical protein [Tumidithrix elongata RA019]
MFSLYPLQPMILATSLRRFTQSFVGILAEMFVLQENLWTGCPITETGMGAETAKGTNDGCKLHAVASFGGTSFGSKGYAKSDRDRSERSSYNSPNSLNLNIDKIRAHNTSGRYWLTAIPT